MLAAGHSHSAAITDSARLYMWGSNSDCRLLIDENENRFIPTLTLLEKLKDAAQTNTPITGEAYEPVYVSLGVTHSAVITRSGEVFTGGSKLDGQLGLAYNKQGLQKSIGSSTGDIYQVKDANLQREISHPLHLVEGFGFRHGNRAVQVACGDGYTLVLNERKDLFSFGKTAHGRLGLGPVKGESVSEPTLVGGALEGEKVAMVAAGCRHASCVTESGHLYTWGFNFYE